MSLSPSGLPEISFVLPAFNEREAVPIMHSRLTQVAVELGMPYEIVWVNDGSRDGTTEVLQELLKSDPAVTVVHLSRNFGHMAALTAGLERARGTAAVVTMDADGQHPPELIPEMVALWQEGADIVQTLRTETEDSTQTKKGTSRLFYTLFNRCSDFPIPDGAADFRLMDRQVVNALNDLPERSRFMRGLVHWVGFNILYLPFVAPSRQTGVTKYSTLRMLKFALSGITSFSYFPLRVVFLLGVFTLLCALAYLLYVLVAIAGGALLVPGWASIILAILVLGGVQLICLGVACEYLSRIYEEIKRRPIYLEKKMDEGRKRQASL